MSLLSKTYPARRTTATKVQISDSDLFRERYLAFKSVSHYKSTGRDSCSKGKHWESDSFRRWKTKLEISGNRRMRSIPTKRLPVYPKGIPQITKTVYGVQKSIRFSVGARCATLSLRDGTKPLSFLVPPLNKEYVLEGFARRSRLHARHRAPQLPWA